MNENKLAIEISEKTRQGKFQGKFGALRFENKHLKLARQMAKKKTAAGEKSLEKAYGAASSTYYEAAGNALAHFRMAKWQFWWLFRAVWYLHSKAWRYSNRMVSLAGRIEFMGNDQLDIRASIAERCWRYKEAERCVDIAIRRNNLSDDTRVLLLLHQIRHHLRLGQIGTAGRIFQEIDQIIAQGEISKLTLVRTQRVWISYQKKSDSRWDEIQLSLAKAEDLAQEADLYDQVLKIRAGI